MNYFKHFISSNKLISILIVLLVVGVVIALSNVFGELTPIKSIKIFSEQCDFSKKAPGAWRITKSAMWSEKGIAEIIIDVDTIRKSRSRYTDVILVLDVSASMDENRMGKVKQATVELINRLLETEGNRVAVISFDTTSTIHSGLTDNKDELISSINSLVASGNTNYYQALVNVDSILKTYIKEEDREMSVLFLTDGYPTEDIPNEVGFFNYLKSKYSFVIFNAIQYEIGSSILEPLKKISDYQYAASINNLYDVLYDVAIPAFNYDEFTISDFINSDAFYVDKEIDIKAESGKVQFDKGRQKVTWKLAGLKSGRSSKLIIKARLKTELMGINGIYPTNNHVEVVSLLNGVNENVTSRDTPLLLNKYMVMYEANKPDECTLEGIVPAEKSYSVYDMIEISSNQLKCAGYKFKGWEGVTDGVRIMSDEYFNMPEADVTIRGTWSNLSIEVSMDGMVEENLTLYKQVRNDVSDSLKYAKKYEGDTSTFIGDKDIYYYYGKAQNNNVYFANYCWKIVRTTDTGGVKIIYNGLPNSSGGCNNTEVNTMLTKEQMNLSEAVVAFNSSSSSPADVGYMYNTRYVYNTKTVSSSKFRYGNDFTWNGTNYTLTGTVDSTGIPSSINTHHYTCFNTTGTCNTLSYIFYVYNNSPYYINLSSGKSVEDALDEMLYNDNVNTKNSAIKAVVDYWYQNNMTDYTAYLEDTVWCNDRSLTNKETNGWNPNGGLTNEGLLYKSYSDRINFTCKNKNDRFTVSKANGNGRLIYPVGLIDASESFLAYDGNSPHDTVESYWGLSPSDFNHYRGVVFLVYYARAWGSSIHLKRGVRPVVSLRPNIEFMSGDGSVANPYVIFTD